MKVEIVKNESGNHVKINFDKNSTSQDVDTAIQTVKSLLTVGQTHESTNAKGRQQING